MRSKPILLAVLLIFIVSASGFAQEDSPLTKNVNKILVHWILKRASLEEAVSDLDGVFEEITKSKLVYLLRLNDEWPIDEDKFLEQYEYLNKLDFLWTLESFQEARDIPLDQLIDDGLEHDYALTALTFHDDDVEAKYEALKKTDSIDETGRDFFTKALKFRQQLRGSFRGEVVTLNGERSLTSVVFSPDKKFLAVSDESEIVRIYNIENIKKPVLHKEFIAFVANDISAMNFSLDGSKLILATTGSELNIREVHKQRGRAWTSLGQFSGINLSLAFSAKGKRFAAADSANANVRLFKIDRFFPFDETEKIKTGANLQSIALSPDGEYLALGCLHGTTIRNIKTEFEYSSYLERVVSALAFSPSGSLIAEASYKHDNNVNGDFLIKIRKVRITLDTIISLKGHSDKIQSLAFSPDGKYLASADKAGLLKIWRLYTTFNPDITLLGPWLPKADQK